MIIILTILFALAVIGIGYWIACKRKSKRYIDASISKRKMRIILTILFALAVIGIGDWIACKRKRTRGMIMTRAKEFFSGLKKAISKEIQGKKPEERNTEG
jgi:Tfp pilus assembly protein PilO